MILGLSGDFGSGGKCLGTAVSDAWNGTYVAETPDAAVKGGEVGRVVEGLGDVMGGRGGGCSFKLSTRG